MSETNTHLNCDSKTPQIRNNSNPEKLDIKAYAPPGDIPVEEETANTGLLNKAGEISSEALFANNRLIQKKIEMRPVDPPIGVLIGEGGTGKTTLLSKICEIKTEADLSQTSKTKNIFKNLSKVGEYPFELIDTPGTETSNFTHKKAVLLRESLTDCEVSTIFIFVKYDARHVRMAESLFKVLALVQQYEKKVVTVITHWELSSNPKEEEEHIKAMLGQDFAGIILSSKNDNPLEIADLIYSFLQKIPGEKLELPEQEFFLNFKFSQDSLEVDGQTEEKEKEKPHDAERKSRLDSGLGSMACSLI